MSVKYFIVGKTDFILTKGWQVNNGLFLMFVFSQNYTENITLLCIM